MQHVIAGAASNGVAASWHGSRGAAHSASTSHGHNSDPRITAVVSVAVNR